jgi:hypothetical protein
MKKIIFQLIIILFPCFVAGQTSGVDCSHLSIEDIQLVKDTNLMKLTISNTCTNCNLDTCSVYLDLHVIKTVSPFDTIASAFGGRVPANTSQEIWILHTAVTSLPPLNELKVSLVNGACGCAAIPFSSNIGLLLNSLAHYMHVSPNPFKDALFISIHKQSVKQAVFLIRNILGSVVFCEQENMLPYPSIKTINLNGLPQGVYVLDILIDEERLMKTIIKE